MLRTRDTEREVDCSILDYILKTVLHFSQMVMWLVEFSLQVRAKGKDFFFFRGGRWGTGNAETSSIADILVEAVLSYICMKNWMFLIWVHSRFCHWLNAFCHRQSWLPVLDAYLILYTIFYCIPVVLCLPCLTTFVSPSRIRTVPTRVLLFLRGTLHRAVACSLLDYLIPWSGPSFFNQVCLVSCIECFQSVVTSEVQFRMKKRKSSRCVF